MTRDAVLLMIILGGLGMIMVADGKGATPMESLLPGSATTLHDAAQAADLIVVAVVDSSVVGDPTAPGSATYTLKVTVSRILKGAEDRKEVSFDIRVLSLKGESGPSLKRAYIVFVKIEPDKSWSFIKMLPATEENIGAVATMVIKLPGSGTKLRDATKSADLIVVAVVDSSVVGDPTAPGSATYTLKVTVSRILKGAEDRKEVSFDIRVLSLKGESGPSLKRAYIVFVKTEPDKSWSFIKMLPATEENVADVTKIIATPPGQE